MSSRTFVRFWLRGCANNQPRVNNVALIVPPGGPGYYKDFTPDASGAIAGSIYRNSEIECNGATGNTWYGVQVYRDGKPGPETPYSVVAATFNLNTATPTVQAPPPPPATFPYIMANPIAPQTISNFPLNFGSGSGIGANYQGGLQVAGTYLRSNGSSVFAPVSANQIAADLLVTPTLNGLVYWNGSGLSNSPTGGAGTLCATSANGGAPAWSSCAGSASTSWSSLSAPSGNLALNMGVRTTAFTWGTGTGASSLFTFDGSAGNGSGATLRVKGQPSGSPLRVDAANGSQLFEVSPTAVITAVPSFTSANVSVNGDLTQTQTTPATGSANQSSYLYCLDGSYWQGASSTDRWCWQNVLGNPPSPTSTLTLTHVGTNFSATLNIPGTIRTTAPQSMDIRGGDASGSGAGSYATFAAGNGGPTGEGGIATVQGGLGGETSGNGGGAGLIGGSATSGFGGQVSIIGGDGGGMSNSGGNILIFAGNGVNGNASGGHVFIQSGNRNGSGAVGQIRFRHGDFSKDAVVDFSQMQSGQSA